MIVTLIQGFIIYILIVMIIRHLKPFVEHFNINDYNDLKNELKNDIDNDNEKDKKNKKFHTQDDLKSTSPLFKTKVVFPTSPVPSTFKKGIVDWEKAIPLFGSIDIDVRMRGASNRRGIPDMGTYDCQDITFQKKGTTAPSGTTPPGTTLSISSNETDLDEIVKKNNTLEQCAKDCQGNENCNGFRYSKKSKTCILTKGVKILKGTNDKKYTVSKCLNRNKVYVYDEYGNLNPTWIEKGEYIYYPKIEQKANKSNNGTECVNLDINNMFYFKNCKDKPCYKIPEGVLNQCIEQSDISRNKTLVNPSYILNCPAGKHINNTDEPVECIKCAPGTYQDQKTSIDKKKDGLWTSSCKKCDKGTFTDVEGLAKCKKCIPGTYNDKKGAHNCPVCPYNKFTGSVGQENCGLCTRNEVASANRTKCVLLKPIQVAFNKKMIQGARININIGCLTESYSTIESWPEWLNMKKSKASKKEAVAGRFPKHYQVKACRYDDNWSRDEFGKNCYKSSLFLATCNRFKCTEGSFKSREGGYGFDRFLLVVNALESTTKYTLYKKTNKITFIHQSSAGQISDIYNKQKLGIGMKTKNLINTEITAGSKPFQLVALNHCTATETGKAIIPAIFIPTSAEFKRIIGDKKFVNEKYIIEMNIEIDILGLLYDKGDKRAGYKCNIKGTPLTPMNKSTKIYYLTRTAKQLVWQAGSPAGFASYIFDVKI